MPSHPTPEILPALIQSEEWMAGFQPVQKRKEARAIYDWSFTDHFSSICTIHEISDCVAGEEPPDFVLVGTNKIAVEVSLIVTGRKAIYDREGAKIGGYTSTLLSAQPTREFRAAAQAGTLPDNSLVRPLAVNTVDLDASYFEQAEKRIVTKISAAKQYGGRYAHTVILLHDELSEFESCLERRLPRLRSFCQSLNAPRTIEVIVMNSGMGSSGVAHVIT